MYNQAQIEALHKRISALERQIEQLKVQEKSTQFFVLTDGVTAPSAIVGLALIYVDTSDGDLKVRFGDGTTQTLATD